MPEQTFINMVDGPDQPTGSEREDEKALLEKCLDYLKRYKADVEQLNLKREKSNKAYMQEKYGNEVDGRSKVVMSDVADTIEWIKPALMRIFYGGTEVVKLEPQGKEDTDGAKLLEEKVNFDFQKGLNGFLLLYDWFDDAMKGKIGVVKYWWEKRDEIKKKRFNAPLSTEELMLQLNDPDFIPKTMEDVPDQPGMFKVTGGIIKHISKPMAEVIPPEEFVGDIYAVDYKKEDFCAHRKRVHISALVKDYGVKREDLMYDAETASMQDTILWQRFKDLGGAMFMRDMGDKDYFYIYECYVNDYSSGEKEPTKLTLCGTRELAREDNTYGGPPFCCISPVRIAHRAIGRSISELVEDIQELRTALARYILDNIYYQNNAREIWNPWRANMDDVQNNQYPGGKIRTLVDIDPQTCMMPLPVKPMAPWVADMFDRVEQWKENRTGITRYNQGGDANSLNKTAHGISQIMSASMQRIDLIARIFAETGVKDLFTAFAEMNIEYGEDSVDFRLNDQWQTIQRDQIDVNYDVNVSAGIGTGTREMTVQQMMQMLQLSLPQMQLGTVTPENVYNIMKVIYENLGRKDGDSFVTNPMAQMQPQMMGGQANAEGSFEAANPAGLPGQGGDFGGGAPPLGEPNFAGVLQ